MGVAPYGDDQIGWGEVYDSRLATLPHFATPSTGPVEVNRSVTPTCVEHAPALYRDLSANDVAFLVRHGVYRLSRRVIVKTEGHVERGDFEGFEPARFVTASFKLF